MEATVKQIQELEDAGCEMVRMAVFDKEDAYAIADIKKQVHIPLVADIHFDYRLALIAIESGIDYYHLMLNFLLETLLFLLFSFLSPNTIINYFTSFSNSFNKSSKSGGKESPVDLLSHAGVDPLDDAIYDDAFHYFEDLLNEFEKLVK